MRIMTPVLLAAALVFAPTQLVLAQGKGGGAANANSPSSPTRATGQERAEQRKERAKMTIPANKGKGTTRRATPATKATPAVPGSSTGTSTVPATRATPAVPAAK